MMTTWQCAGCKKVWQAEEPPAECACGCRIVREVAVVPVAAQSPVSEVTTSPHVVPRAGGGRPPWAAVFAGAAAALLVAGVAFWLGRSGRPTAVPSAEGAASAPSIRNAAPAKPAASLNAGDTQTFDLGNGVMLEMVYCPPGTFWMGSLEDEENRDNDELRHRVTLTKGFWIGKYEVAQKQWQAVMGSNPSHFKGDDLPVEHVSWDDCQEFFRRLNARVLGGGFRLPTEAEWECACRAGTETAFCYGDRLDASMANFDGNYPYGGATKGVYREKTTAVGSFKPNAWGLFDMHGNVWEWCQDWKGDYPAYGVSDPGGAGSGTDRVARGGSWYGRARSCRSASRNNNVPSNRNDRLGFRLASTMPGQGRVPSGVARVPPTRGNEQVGARAAGSASERRAGI